MVSPWITTIVIIFGILVSIGCVIAYLRVYKNSAWSASRKPESNTPPLAVFPHDEMPMKDQNEPPNNDKH
ncbi:hypothetical protein [Paenibacillus spongiae]|uniref:YtzI protein n=1 Tax=Paenibacillus spongiae TaxID=2909671 RepID=A0ABY5SA81_9BACL|nr:hypothetical protein [Paenibacillus spongiae]UVI30861.1 hypothetical protein L1F29_03010 [Paenibacillus spongiae]